MTPQELLAMAQLLGAEGTNLSPTDVQRHLTEEGFQAFIGLYELSVFSHVSSCGRFVYRTAEKTVGQLRICAFAPGVRIEVGPSAVARLEVSR